MSSNNDSYNDKIYYRLSTKGESFEDINREKTDILGWDYTDVLYSFLGIYVIGVWAYCNNKHDKKGTKITINNKNNLDETKNEDKPDDAENKYNPDINLKLCITEHCKIKFNTGRQHVSRNYCLDQYEEFKNLNKNDELNNFIKQYETVGN